VRRIQASPSEGTGKGSYRAKPRGAGSAAGSIFLSILLALQGIPLNPRDTGTVSGVLRNTEGNPAAGIRVSALARSETTESALGSALASIAETDENGRYRLEGVPPGQYYIVAGRIDMPTFYPGASKIIDGAVVRVTRGAALSGMDISARNQDCRTRGNRA
jgi:hypothetical protein